jgi:hypothetical protein
MQTFFFDMNDGGVPVRDRLGIKFNTSLEAIEHSQMLARYYREDSLPDDQDLEISVVDASGREIHREFIHSEQADPETPDIERAHRSDASPHPERM